MSHGIAESSPATAYNGIFTTPSGHTGGRSWPRRATAAISIATKATRSALMWLERTNPQRLYPSAARPCRPARTAHTWANLPGTSTMRDRAAGGDSGGGFSRVYAEPSYQRGVQSTGVRTVPDVAYNADVNSRVSVYDSLAGGPWGEPAPGLLSGLAHRGGQSGTGAGGPEPTHGPSQTLPGIYKVLRAR